MDVGIPSEQIQKSVQQMGISLQQIRGIFLTHEHQDHIQGLEEVLKQVKIPLYFTRSLMLSPQISPWVNAGSMPFDPGKKFYLGKLEVLPFPVPHDAVSPVGFVFFYQGAKIAYFVDLGSVPPHLLPLLEDIDVLLLESNHDLNMLANGPYPSHLKNRIRSPRGHLSNLQAGKVLQQLSPSVRKPVQVFLSHLSEVNNTPEIALQTAKDLLKASRNSDYFFLDYCPRGAMSKLWEKRL